jgi:hypothetical protein
LEAVDAYRIGVVDDRSGDGFRNVLRMVYSAIPVVRESFRN